MRILKKISWLLPVLLLSSCQEENVTSNSGDEVYTDYYDQNAYDGGLTYQTFYDELSPYGSWVDYSGYGYVWVPSRYPGFTPYYTDGHWVYTSYGWTWVSDFNWGWGPFHYGNWYFDDYYGWLWVPGYSWAPAWVIWGNYSDYYCWAPIGPHVAVNANYRPRPNSWNVIPRQHITAVRLADHAVNKDAVPDINGKVNIINNTNAYRQSVYFAGPDQREVERVTGQKINPISVTPAKSPGAPQVKDNELSIYRPEISRSPATKHGAPAKVAKPEEIQPTNKGENMNPAERTPIRPEPRTNNPPSQREPNQNRPVEQPHDRGFIPQENRNVQPPPQRENRNVQPQQMPRQNAPVNRAPSNPPLQSQRPRRK